MRKFTIAQSATALAVLATVGAGALQVAPALADNKAPAATEQSTAAPAKDAVATATHVGLALGVGFLLSGGVAYALSKSWGLINGHGSRDRELE